MIDIQRDRGVIEVNMNLFPRYLQGRCDRIVIISTLKLPFLEYIIAHFQTQLNGIPNYHVNVVFLCPQKRSTVGLEHTVAASSIHPRKIFEKGYAAPRLRLKKCSNHLSFQSKKPGENPKFRDILKAVAANVPWEYFDDPLGLGSKFFMDLVNQGDYDPMECDTYDFIGF